MRLANPRNMDSLTIELSRGPCFGMCPSYTITIHGNGQVEYAGGRFANPDPKTGAVNREQIVEVLQHLDRIHFFTLEDRAFVWCFDAPSVAVSVSVDGKTKRIVSDASCVGTKSGPQAEFVRTASEIDGIVGSDQWVRCDERCGK
jgi:hypothetical protein